MADLCESLDGTLLDGSEHENGDSKVELDDVESSFSGDDVRRKNKPSRSRPKPRGRRIKFFPPTSKKMPSLTSLIVL